MGIKISIFTGLFFVFAISLSAQVSHEKWDALLKAHVDQQGKVNYKGFVADVSALQEYLELLSENPAGEGWSRNEKLAYWINAYNAFTVKLIVDNYPLKSIKDLNTPISITGVSTIWDKRFFKIGGKDMSLNNIEHGILRKDFNEPRIHFAINCASYSCPELRKEAYIGRLIEDQLQEQATLFINDPKRNIIAEDVMHISMIFQWFTGDFTKHGTLVDYVRKYTATPINERARVKFIDYDWSLNE